MLYEVIHSFPTRRSSDLLLIKGGRVINPALQQDEVCDILIENDKIKEIGRDIQAPEAQIYDAEGLIVAPGFIDMHGLYARRG